MSTTDTNNYKIKSDSSLFIGLLLSYLSAFFWIIYTFYYSAEIYCWDDCNEIFMLLLTIIASINGLILILLFTYQFINIKNKTFKTFLGILIVCFSNPIAGSLILIFDIDKYNYNKKKLKIFSDSDKSLVEKISSEIEKLNLLFEKGLITKEEYNLVREKIINNNYF
jgi:uncharacterized membrane protein